MADENTPLLRPKPTKRRALHSYVTTIGSLLLLSLIIHWYRTILPTALSDSQAQQLDDFPGIHAYNEYLGQFKAPHSANSRENEHMREWISSVALDLQREAAESGVKVDVVSQDPSRLAFRQDWFKKDEYWFVDSRNVIVRLHGENEDALLINAHYDSVPSSFGVTDNGMGVSTALELLRYFVHHPPRQTIIFLFNNMEEGGLVGARTFVNHPWYSKIKLFINLEGAGAGGRAMLFRSSNLNAVKKVAHSSAGYLHSSPLGNDMMKSNLLKSDTDYSVFTENGVPGLDIAFYGPRSHYHTPRDDLQHTTPEALQYMGQYALGAVKAIVNSDDMLDTTHEQESFIFFDVLGRFMFVYSFTLYQVFNVLALLAVPSVALFIFIRRYGKRDDVSGCAKDRALLVGYGVAAVLNAVLFSLVFTLIAVYIMTKLKPSVTYGNAYLTVLYLVSAIFLGLLTSQWILPARAKSIMFTTDASWYGLISFWWLFVVLAVFVGTKKIAGLYFAVDLLTYTSIAALVHEFVPKNKKFRSPLIFFTQILVPFVLLVEIALLSVDSMRHATPDGTPEMAVYLLIAFPFILIILNFLPWVYVAGSLPQATATSGCVFILLFVICCLLSPFNTAYSPNKVVFNQFYNVTSGISTVSLVTFTGLKSLLKETLPKPELNTLSCETISSNGLTLCRYETDLVPIYAGNASLHEFYHSNVSKACDDTKCTVEFEYAAKNSLMCRVDFSNGPVQGTAWVNGAQATNGAGEGIASIVSYVKAYQKPVQVRLAYPATEQHDATLSCYYDEWIQHQIPAFSTLRNDLPASVVLAIRGQGISLASFDTIEL